MLDRAPCGAGALLTRRAPLPQNPRPVRLALSDYDFDLPDALIARAPLERRDASRLLVLDRASGAIAHRSFRDWPGLLRPGDLVVLNDTRVIPARLLGRKQGSGGRVELLLVRPDADVEAARRARRPGGRGELGLSRPGQQGAPGGDGGRARRRLGDGAGGARRGRAPRPLRGRGLRRRAARARPAGCRCRPTSRASPRPRTGPATRRSTRGRTARWPRPPRGSTSPPETFAALEARGVERRFVTLDVGPGTFLPVRGDDESTHRMHAERYDVPDETAEAVNRARARGPARRGRRDDGGPHAGERGRARAGCAPAPAPPGCSSARRYAFQAVDALLTNFHLPRSTLLMLVSAFAGRERGARRLPGGRRRALPLLQLRRCDVHRRGSRAGEPPLRAPPPRRRDPGAPRAAAHRRTARSRRRSSCRWAPRPR